MGCKAASFYKAVRQESFFLMDWEGGGGGWGGVLNDVS